MRMRCPAGTFKPSIGGATPSVCTLCAAEYIDDDADPTTPCVRRLKFEVIRFSRGSKFAVGGRVAAPLVVAANHPQSVAPVLIRNTVNNVSDHFQFSLSDAPAGFLVDPRTGQIEVRPEDAPAGPRDVLEYTATLYAVDAIGARAVVEHLPIEIRMADGDVAANGPGGEPCKHGAVVDTTPFNFEFTCDCSETKFVGDNCEHDVPAYWVYAVVGISVAAVGLLAHQQLRAWRQRAKENAPFSFTEILHDLERDGTFKFAVERHGDVQHDRAQSTAGASTPFATKTSARSVARKPGARRNWFASKDERHTEDVPLLALNDAEHGASDDDDPLLELDLAAGLAGHAHGLVHKAASAGGGGGGRSRGGAAELCVHLNAPKEIDPRHVTTIAEIGAGAFGTVWEGLLSVPTGEGGGGARHTVPIAVKKPKAAAGKGGKTRELMLKEAAIGAQFDHENVSRLIGVITSNNQCAVIMELCARGGLHTLLISEAFHRNEEAIAEPVVIGILRDVVEGMVYLSSGQFIHRDLSARNVLVDAGWVCKIADFGLSKALGGKGQCVKANATPLLTERVACFLDFVGFATRAGGGEGAHVDLLSTVEQTKSAWPPLTRVVIIQRPMYLARYYYRAKGDTDLPLRWLAPEALVEEKFTVASDVYAFGVMAWEVVSRGALPFTQRSNIQVGDLVCTQ